MPKITVTEDLLHKGEHVAKGTELEVDQQTAGNLLSSGRAVPTPTAEEKKAAKDAAAAAEKLAKAEEDAAEAKAKADDELAKARSEADAAAVRNRAKPATAEGNKAIIK